MVRIILLCTKNCDMYTFAQTALLVFHTLHCPPCTALHCLALNIKHTTALPALLVAVSLIFTPTRLLRRPRATKPLLGEDDGDDENFLLLDHTYIVCTAVLSYFYM